jgi:hypothetical protein
VINVFFDRKEIIIAVDKALEATLFIAENVYYKPEALDSIINVISD